MMYPGVNETADAERFPFPSMPPPHAPLAAQSFESISPADSGCALSSPGTRLHERVDSDVGSGSGAGSGSRSAMFVPTTRSEITAGLSSAAGASTRPAKGGSGITMDVTFEELEELSPMVW